MDPQAQPNPKRWPLSRKQTLLLAGGIIVLIIIIIIAVASTNNNKTQQSSNQPTTHERAGYDLDKLGDAIADPFAIKFTSVETPTTYKGNGEVQACNVLTIPEITDQGLLIKADNSPTALTRSFNDGVGKGDYNQNIFGSSISGQSLKAEVNNCHYLLQSDGGVSSISINVFQPFAVPTSVVDEEVQANYTAAGKTEGLDVFTKKASTLAEGRDTTEYMIMQPGKGAFYLAIRLEEASDSKKQTLLQTAAKNFIREQANPTGPSSVSYDSPIYDKDIVRACDLITNDHVKTLSGRDAGPLVHEGLAPSIGAIKFPTGSDQTTSLYIDNECTRSTTGGGSGLGSDGTGDLSLKVTTTSFLTDTPAKQAIELQRQTGPNNRGSLALTEGVGDASVAYTDISGGHHVIFSKGRIIVDVELDQFAQRITRTTSLAAAAEKLAPIAQEMATKVKE